MTKAVLKKQNGLWTSLEVSGHSGYSTAGSDIVCAGISATVINSLNLIIKLLGKNVKFTENQEEGYMKLEVIKNNFNQSSREFLELTVENLYESLQQISDIYPNHLKIKIEK